MWGKCLNIRRQWTKLCNFEVPCLYISTSFMLSMKLNGIGRECSSMYVEDFLLKKCTKFISWERQVVGYQNGS